MANATAGATCEVPYGAQDVAFLVGNTVTVLGMQIGFALLEAGSVSRKNKVRGAGATEQFADPAPGVARSRSGAGDGRPARADPARADEHHDEERG